MMQHRAAEPQTVERMRQLELLAELVMPLPLGLNAAKAQNTYWELLQKVFPDFRRQAEAGDQAAQIWTTQFLALGDRLGFAVKGLKEAPVTLQQAA